MNTLPMRLSLFLFAMLSLIACQDPLPTVTVLHPDPNPMTPADPKWTPQPHRDRPRQICTNSSGSKAWITLAGIEDAPGTQVAVVDLAGQKPLKRLDLPGTPWSCAVSPDDRYVVITLRYSDHAIVLDAQTDAEVARIPVPFYSEGVLFSPTGSRVFLSNRWKDSVLWWDVDIRNDFQVLSTNYDQVPAEDPMGTPVSDNPGPMAISTDGTKLFVGSVAGCTIAVLDARTGALIDVDQDPKTTTRGAPKGISHLDFHSPVGGLAVKDAYLFIADTGRGLGGQPTTGLDVDDNGEPGDGTANLSFQDQQNEIGVVDTASLHEVHRYTSDSICCKDFRDVDANHPGKGLALPLADQWSPDVVNFLPPKENWLVAGALPEAMVVQGQSLWVAFAGSNEVQGFGIGTTGQLTPLQTAGQLYHTGFNPKSIASAGKDRVVTVNRLGESLTFIDVTKATGKAESHVIIGDNKAGPFPQTDAEMGEGINEMTSVFTIDGDQTCVQCHRDNGSIARPFVMPLQNSRAWSVRAVMAQRGLYDTRPWFFESAMNEDNFFPVLNEFVRRENFCCEELDMMIWAKYPKISACQNDPTLPGCNHVLHCADDPPPECATRPYGSPQFSTRSAFIKDAANKLFGRETAFGDALYNLDLNGKKQPLELNFDGMTKAVGLFMMRTPRLLPNPNRHLNLPTAARGKVLFEQAGVGCNSCHPLPNTTTTPLPVPFSPFGMPVRFPPVVSPELRPDGSDAMLVNDAFIATFPLTEQTAAGLFVGSTPLRGLWDRPQTRFYHDGRARSLRETLATPGHAILKAGEIGHNERHGSFDTHGGTSQLTPYQLQDLINFVLTL